MPEIRLLYVVLGFSLLFAVAAFRFFPEQPLQPRQPVSTLARSVAADGEPIRPLPLAMALDKRKVDLGRRLFSDPRFSRNNAMSCASCHNLNAAGVDHLPTAMGGDGHPEARNTPTVFNSGFNFAQFWDGRARNLEDQVDGPLHNPQEFDSNWSELIAKLARDPYYARQFKQIYRDGLRARNVKDAIATFERSLITPNAPFDRYLRGDPDAIDAQEKRGYYLFKSLGCVSCHQGMNVGGNLFQKFGVMGDYLGSRDHLTQSDYGRFNVTGRPEDRFVFKVPSLRNVAVTAPYFHDGSAKTLPTAVEIMAKYQLGRTLNPQEVKDIVSFLNTLTGEYQGKPL